MTSKNMFVLARGAASWLNRQNTTKLLRMCSYVVDEDVKKQDWKSKSNFYNDWRNTEAFGATVKDQVSKSESNQDNSSFWLALCDKKAAKVKTKTKKTKKKNDDEGSLEDIVAQATLELQHKSSNNVPELNPPTKKDPKKPKSEIIKNEKTNATISYDNPLKTILTPAVMVDLDRDKIRKEIFVLKAAVAEARAKDKKDKLPSVTAILNATMPQENRLALQVWEERMIRELGQDGFRRYRASLLRRGHRLHSYVEAKLLGDQENAAKVAAEAAEDQVSANHIRSVAKRLKELECPVALEAHVVHPTLQYHGVIDAVAVNKRSGELTLIDWKTSGKRRATLNSTFDAPLQLAAYAGASNADPRHRFRVRRACVVVVRGDGQGPEANAIAMDQNMLEVYWQKWLDRLETYRRMREYEENK